MARRIEIYFLHDYSTPKSAYPNSIKISKIVDSILPSIINNGFTVNFQLVDETDSQLINDFAFKKLTKFPCAQMGQRVFNGPDKVEELLEFVVKKKGANVRSKTPEEMVKETQLNDMLQGDDPGEGNGDEYGAMGNNDALRKKTDQMAEQRRQSQAKYSKMPKMTPEMAKMRQLQESLKNKHPMQQPTQQRPTRNQMPDNVDPEDHRYKNEVTPMLETKPADMMRNMKNDSRDPLGDGGELTRQGINKFWENQTTTPGT